MAKKFLFSTLLFAVVFSSMAQSSSAKTSFYLELLGNGGPYSLNFEQYLFSNINGRVGFASWTNEVDFGEESFFTIPIMANALFGEKNSKLELGAGVMLGRKSFKPTSSLGEEERKESISNLTGVIGYRYQRPAGGIIFRAGLTPFLALGDEEDPYPDNGFSLSGGLSLGYNF